MPKVANVPIIYYFCRNYIDHEAFSDLQHHIAAVPIYDSKDQDRSTAID